jgi:hypothetical protein
MTFRAIWPLQTGPWMKVLAIPIPGLHYESILPSKGAPERLLEKAIPRTALPSGGWPSLRGKPRKSLFLEDQNLNPPVFEPAFIRCIGR